MMADEEFERRLEALERDGLGTSLSGRQIVVFVGTCFVLPALIAFLGRGLL